MKELRFHPYFREMIVTTAEDSFNIFKPNLDPDEQPGVVKPENTEETKSSDVDYKGGDYWQDSEDEEEEEKRMVRVAKKLNRDRSVKREKKDKDGKRRKLQ